jgi:hypothetical protein
MSKILVLNVHGENDYFRHDDVVATREIIKNTFSLDQPYHSFT